MDLDASAYLAVFEANPLPLFVADRETLQILIVNRAACDHYGWSREEFLTMTLRDMRPPELVTHFEQSYADTNKDLARPYSRQGRHVTKDGRVLDVTLEISSFMLGARHVSLAVVTDVTGIAQVERRFRLLVEHSVDGIALTNLDNIVEYVSPGGQHILGFPASEVVGTSPAPRAHPDDIPRWTPPAPGETKRNVARMKHRDGSWRWIESTTTNLTHEPAVRAYVSNYRDITERTEAQQRLEFLLSATSAITYTARASGDFGATFIGTNVRHVLGYEPSAFYDDPGFWRANIHPDDRPRVDAELAELPDSLLLQYRFRHSDGSYRWMRDAAHVIRDAGGTPTEVVGYWIDVTEQVAAEAGLRRSEANFRTLIERTPVATFVHRAGTYVYVNPAGVAMLGYGSAAEIIGKSVLACIHPDDRPAIQKRIVQLRTTGSVPTGTTRMLRADGSSFVFEAAVMVLDFDGQPSNVVMGTDVSERHELFARIAMADRMLTVGTLAAGVAHEVNNPLAYIATNLETLAHDLPNILLGPRSRLAPDGLRGLVDDARDGVKRVSAIVRDLRALSRPDVETRGPVDVVEVLGAALKMAHNEIRHRATIVRDFGEALPCVEGDAVKLGQVFVNLLLNAAHAIPDGHAERNEIRIGAAVDRAHVRIEIRDSGVGIPAPIVHRIFDPFFTTKDPGVGMGLGLSISHHIVRSMGGEITVDSAPGKGSTFGVVLPVAAIQRAPAVQPVETVRQQTGRILLIDDEAAVGRSLALSLAPETEVIAVTRAEDALIRLAGGERFDAILCDLMMPEISGIELYDRLVRVAPDYTTRIIFMTGGAFTPQARDFLAKLDRPHLEKPFSEAQVRRAIESVVR